MPGCFASELEGEITSVKYAGTVGSTWDFFTFLCVWYYNYTHTSEGLWPLDCCQLAPNKQITLSNPNYKIASKCIADYWAACDTQLWNGHL